MDELYLKLVSDLRDILLPHKRELVLEVLLMSVAGAAISWLSENGEIHDSSKMKAILISRLEENIDTAIQVAYSGTFRGN